MIGKQLIDISNRDDMNWNEYNWYFDQKSAPIDTSVGDTSDPWKTKSVTCIGSDCCYEGISYDSNKNICVPNTIYEQENPQSDVNTSQQTESFRGLGKYLFTHVKSSSLNNTISPVFSSLSKF